MEKRLGTLNEPKARRGEMHTDHKAEGIYDIEYLPKDALWNEAWSIPWYTVGGLTVLPKNGRKKNV